ncbi:MAG: hypothetical protein AB7S38_02075 [Vulcanimicrobiota bacterium]
MQQLIEELKALHEGVLGQPLVEEREPERVLARLRAGESDFPLALRWDDQPHSVVVESLRSERVFFFNPMQAEDVQPGTLLGGTRDGPRRRSEEDGLESVAVEDFRALFSQRQAVCLVPG